MNEIPVTTSHTYDELITLETDFATKNIQVLGVEDPVMNPDSLDTTGGANPQANAGRWLREHRDPSGALQANQVSAPMMIIVKDYYGDQPESGYLPIEQALGFITEQRADRGANPDTGI